MDQLLKCPNCLNIFQEPRSLDCNHILCLNCLSEIFKPDVSPYIDCPICEKQTLVMNSTVELPSIPSLEELLSYYNSVPNITSTTTTSTTSTTTNQIPTTSTVATAATSSTPSRSSPLSSSPIPLSPRYQRLITEPLHDPFHHSPSIIVGNTSNTDFQLDLKPSTSQSSNSSNHTTNSNTSASTASTTNPTININQNLRTAHNQDGSNHNNVQNIVAQLKSKQSPTSKSLGGGIPTLHTSLSSCSISSQLGVASSFVPTPSLPQEFFEDLIRCPFHDEKYKFYCTNKECDRLICLECIIDHNGHQFNRIAKELDNRMSDIESLTVTMANLPNKLLKHKSSIEKKIQDGTTLHRETKQKISADIDLMIKNLIDRRDSLESQIDRDWEDQKQQLNDSVTRMVNYIDMIREANKMTQSLILEKISTEKQCAAHTAMMFMNTSSSSLTTFSAMDLNAVSPGLKGMASPPPSTLLKSSQSLYSIHSHSNSPSLSASTTNSIPSSPPMPSHLNNEYYTKVVIALFSRYTALKELETNSNEILNEMITNIEWKWDPEFQFPQLFRAAQQQQQQSNNIKISHSSSSNSSSSSSMAKKSPIQQSPLSTSPKKGSESPKVKSTTPNKKPMVPPLSFDKSMSSNSLISNSSAVVPKSQTPPPISPPKQLQQPSLSSNTSIPATTQKVVMKKNPVFGKLLTRKDSSINTRQNFLYAIGGEHSEGTVEMYDIQNNRWKYVSQLPIPTSEFASFFDSMNYIYCIGGKATPYQINKYHIEKDQWELVPFRLKIARAGHCAVYDGRRYVYIIGGEGSVAAKLVERLDITTLELVAMEPMKYGRRHFNCFFDGFKHIYAVDGYASKDQESTIEVYDIESNKWSVLTTIQNPRYMASVSYDGTRFIAISGGVHRCTAHDIQLIERFDTQQQTWERLDEKYFTNSNTTNTAGNGQTTGNNSPSLTSASSPFSNTKNRLQLYNATVFDGEQFIYYCGLGVDEVRPLLYRYNIRTKKFDKLSSLQHMRLTNQLVLISK